MRLAIPVILACTPLSAALVACAAPAAEPTASLRPVASQTARAANAPAKRDLHPRGASPIWSRHLPATWDLDRDGAVDWAEWTQGLRRTGLFRTWDLNGDGLVERIELGWGLFTSFDLDGSGELTLAEHTRGVAAWWGAPGRFGSALAIDRDQDGLIDRGELVAAVGSGELMGGWDADADGTLNEREFARALLASWDRDGDGALSRAEGPSPQAPAWIAGYRLEP